MVLHLAPWCCADLARSTWGKLPAVSAATEQGKQQLRWEIPAGTETISVSDLSMLELGRTHLCAPGGAQVGMWGMDQMASSSTMNTWIVTLACKTFHVIVTQSPADPAETVPPHPPECSYCQGQHCPEKVMSLWSHCVYTLSFGVFFFGVCSGLGFIISF